MGCGMGGLVTRNGPGGSGRPVPRRDRGMPVTTGFSEPGYRVPGVTDPPTAGSGEDTRTPAHITSAAAPSHCPPAWGGGGVFLGRREQAEERPTRCPSWAGCRNMLSWLTVYRTCPPVRVRVMYPAASRSATMAWTVRSVSPAAALMSRIRAPGSRPISTSTRPCRSAASSCRRSVHDRSCHPSI